MTEVTWSPPILIAADDGPWTPLDDRHRYALPTADTYPILDLQTCISDLDTVVDIGEVLTAQAEQGTFNFGLWHALVISYGRGFQTGRSHEPGMQRAGLRQFLPVLDAEQRSYHEALIRVRNGQVAHSVANGGAAITVAFHADGTFAAIDAFHTGETISTADLRHAVDVAKALRLLAWAERDRLTEELERHWAGRSLTPGELDEAVRARNAFVAEVRARSDSAEDD